MSRDRTRVNDAATVGASLSAYDGPRWQVKGRLEKFNAPSADVFAGKVEPDEVIETTGNVLTYRGAGVLWQGLTSASAITATTGTVLTVFDNTNASILVGDDASTSNPSQVDLSASSASTNRAVLGMDATYPTHTTGATSTAAVLVFKGTATTSMANFAWAEWGIGNSTSSTAPFKGCLLNRKVQSLGTKSSAATWAFTATLTLA